MWPLITESFVSENTPPPVKVLHSKPYFSQTQWAPGLTYRSHLPQTLMCRLQWKSSSDRDLIEEMSVLWLSFESLWNNVCSSSISRFSSCGRLTTDDRSSSPDLQLKANASCCTHMHLCWICPHEINFLHFILFTLQDDRFHSHRDILTEM